MGTGPAPGDPRRAVTRTGWVLGVANVASGAVKVLSPNGPQVRRLPWREGFTSAAVRGIGTAEVLGGLGLVLPRATGVLPTLTPVAAAGLVVFHLCAARVHLRRGELAIVPVNAALAAAALQVAVGRRRRR